MKEPGCVILGIETSCDDTAAAVVLDGRKILSNCVASQIEIHQRYGGVVPEIASRKHLENLPLVIEAALEQAEIRFDDLSAVAVTYGPGLVGALLVGVSTAKALAYACGIPLIGINHLEGHIYANFLINPQLTYPLIALVVSGGHTDLLYLSGPGSYRILGRTRDDAAGEAFDKVARVLGLGYPGGPQIEKLAVTGDPQAIPLPRARLSGNSLDFSFSGLKTAVLNFIQRQKREGINWNPADLAASFQAAIVEPLVDKTVKALHQEGVKTLILAGGVSANVWLREAFQNADLPLGTQVYYPPLELCTDNAAMIAAAGYYRYQRGEISSWNLNAVPNLSLTAK
ncbi:MAG: tRNA (adenosine(37)-N6)-threonylcarbamoyltransferase complex transferase subunit TsaD [Syntrophomonadaceae bacterium]|nr:tRNA (adenosine(37)-N6)-threonylcarbamoyltransferase complex transferase subunit TsaD [Syntrophomonadaceae bacterium]